MKTSKGYEKICDFFKEIKLYKEFIEYQNQKDDYFNKISEVTDNPLEDFANTSIQYWLLTVKHISVKPMLNFAFEKWLNGESIKVIKKKIRY